MPFGVRYTKVGGFRTPVGFQTPTFRTPFQMSVPKGFEGVINPSLSINTIITFDRSIIRRNWKSINRTPLSKLGNYIKQVARRSIRRRKKYSTHSKPGSPPYSHVPGKLPPFKQIYSLPMNFDTAVIIGMVGYNGLAIPGLHEHGGTRIITVPTGKDPVRDAKGRWLYFINTFAKVSATYPARPFIGPAVLKSRQKVPQLWRDSLAFARGDYNRKVS